MKVGIATYSGAQNYGALLQAQALTDYVQLLGYECCLINNWPFDGRWFKPRKNVQDIVVSILKMKQGKKRIKRYEAYREEYLRFSDEVKDLTDVQNLNEVFDCFITGSDQVWNCNNGADEVFFVGFAGDNKNTIAYAPSFGSASIPEQYKNDVIQYLKKIKHISVREKSGAALVETLIGYKPVIVIDPVFLKDVSEWQKIVAPVEINEPYIFVYSTQKSDRLNQAVKAFEKKKNIKIISTHAIPGVHCTVRKDIGPLEFLGYILNAEYVISTSFHATAFSIIFEKNFCVVPHSQTGARVTDLLEDANMAECIWQEKNYQYPQIDYRDAGVNALQDRIDFSKQFLMDCLEDKV